jgi:hypothetical protein
MSRVPADRKALALLPLGEPVVLEPQRLIMALRTLFPELREAQIEVADSPDQSSGLTMMIGNDLLAIMFFGFPIPLETVKPALDGEIIWKEADAVFAAGRSHLLVTAVTSGDSLAQRLQLSWLVTMAVAALRSIYPVTGVFWSSSMTVIEPGRFERLAVAASKGQWPADLWFGVEWFKGESFDRDQALVGRTKGIGYFAARELECGPYALDPNLIGQVIVGLSRYIILSGRVFGDSDTLELGQGSSRVARISYEQSAYGGGAPVMRVVLP